MVTPLALVAGLAAGTVEARPLPAELPPPTSLRSAEPRRADTEVTGDGPGGARRPDPFRRLEALLALDLGHGLELGPGQLRYAQHISSEEVEGREFEVRVNWKLGGARASVRLSL